MNDCLVKVNNVDLTNVADRTKVLEALKNSRGVLNMVSQIGTTLPYKVRRQYVQISNIIDTSITHTISGHSTPMVTGCMDLCLIQ